MQRLYVVSLTLRSNLETQGRITTKTTLSYRQASNPDEATGSVIRITMEAYPDWSVQSCVFTEIKPEHIAVIYNEQRGQWSAEVPEENKEPSHVDQGTAPTSV